MRVLIIHNAGNAALPSGESVVVERDAVALREAGAHVVVEVVRAPAPSSALGAARALKDLFWSRSTLERTSALIATHRPDVIHAHGVLPALSASVFHAARRAGVAAVQTLHNYRWLCIEGGLVRDGEYCTRCVGNAGAAGLLSRCARDSTLVSLALTANNLLHVRSGSLSRVVDHFVAVSEFVRERYLAAGFAPEKVSVRWNTVDAGVSSERTPRSVCFVGRLDRGKGADLLPALVRELDDHSFEIVGVGPLESEIDDAIGGVDRVRRRGRVSPDEVRAALARAAVVVAPSRAAESFGLVVAEAMACGTPVVASERGALPELVNRAGGGLVTSPEPAALASAIRQITSSPELAARFGDAGRDFAARELSAEAGARRLLAIYESAIA